MPDIERIWYSEKKSVKERRKWKDDKSPKLSKIAAEDFDGISAKTFSGKSHRVRTRTE